MSADNDWVWDQMQRLVVIGTFLSYDDQLPVASHCSRGMKKCQDPECPVYRAMKKVVERRENA